MTLNEVHFLRVLLESMMSESLRFSIRDTLIEI